MKKNIASFLRRMANKLDPRSEGEGVVRISLGHVPYMGYTIERYRSLMCSGSEEAAHRLKEQIHSLAEMTAMAEIDQKLLEHGLIRLIDNFGTQDRIVDGIVCKSEGMTVVIELDYE